MYEYSCYWWELERIWHARYESFKNMHAPMTLNDLSYVSTASAGASAAIASPSTASMLLVPLTSQDSRPDTGASGEGRYTGFCTSS